MYKTLLTAKYKRNKPQLHTGVTDCSRSAEYIFYFLSSVINISVVSKHCITRAVNVTFSKGKRFISSFQEPQLKLPMSMIPAISEEPTKGCISGKVHMFSRVPKHFQHAGNAHDREEISTHLLKAFGKDKE